MTSARTLYERLSLSVVQVGVRSRAPQTYQPWDFKFQDGGSASACVVDGHRLLTCAHVVAHAVHLHVRKPGDARMYKASVAALDHDRELAMLSVEDPQFFEGMVAVTLGELPHLQDTITAWGYPTGGSTLSITSGVVSRIEVIASTYALRPMLALQTDAVLTFGNSGGPVLLDDRMVGVVMQGSEKTQMSHIVPVPVIKSFLADLSDGVISGVPDLGVCWQQIQNEDLKSSVGLAATESGVLVVAVVPGSSASGIVQVDDVITTIDDEQLGGDGTYLLRERQRVDFSAIIGAHQVGDTIALEVMRQHVRQRIEVVLRPHVALVRPVRPGQVERYYIHAGFVFQPLTYEYLRVWKDQADDRLISHTMYSFPSEAREEIVLLSQVLAHDVNAGYHHATMLVVARVNGTVIRHLGDLAAAFERPLGRFDVIEVEGLGRRDVAGLQEFGSRLVVDAGRARAAHAEILAHHGISSDRSSELAPP